MVDRQESMGYMSALQQVLENVEEAVNQFISGLINLLPGLLTAAMIMLVGYVIGRLLGSTVKVFLQRIVGLDIWLKRKRLDKALFGVEFSSFIAGSVRWYVYVVFIWLGLSRLGSPELNEFLTSLVFYLPRVVGALILIMLGLLLGEMVRLKVKEEMEIPFKDRMAPASKLLVSFIFFLGAIDALGLNVQFLYQALLLIIAAFVFSIAIAVGVAFGLALKEEARIILRKFVEGEKKEGDEA